MFPDELKKNRDSISLYLQRCIKFMRRLLFILLLVIDGVELHAQEDTRTRRPRVSIAGKVTDSKTGEILPGTSVYLADDKIGTTANDSGLYRISNIPPGHHVVEVSHAGYATIVEHVELTTDL